MVTYNRKELLSHCLSALQAQSRPVDSILVVDNASTDGTLAFVAAEFPTAETLALPLNVGGAGGFHAGMQWAYDRGFDWLWIMDDDGRPAPDCLATLLAAQGAKPSAAAVLIPIQLDEQSGRFYGVDVWRHRPHDVTPDIIARDEPTHGKFLFTFVGPLLSRSVVEQVGLPNKDFFIWFDDHEYALRIQSKPDIEMIAVPRARFFHNYGNTPREVRFLGRRLLRRNVAAWKLYYGTRNQLYILLHTRKNYGELVVYLLVQMRLIATDVVVEPDRWHRVRMRLQGLADGVAGRLGKRV